MLTAAVARRRVIDLAGPLLHIGHEFLERLHRQRRIDDQHAGLASDERNRREVVDRIVGELRVERGADGVGLRREQQRVAVRRGAGDDLGADRGAGAGLVLDDELLPEAFAELLRDHAHRPVDRATRRKRHDHFHRVRRVVLRVQRAGNECAERESRRRERAAEPRRVARSRRAIALRGARGSVRVLTGAILSPPPPADGGERCRRNAAIPTSVPPSMRARTLRTPPSRSTNVKPR